MPAVPSPLQRYAALIVDVNRTKAWNFRQHFVGRVFQSGAGETNTELFARKRHAWWLAPMNARCAGSRCNRRENLASDEEARFDASDERSYRVGSHRLIANPPPFEASVRFLQFFR